MDIKKKLRQYNYTLSDIAHSLNVTQQAISQQVRTGTLPVRRLQDIAHIVGCTAADLLSDDTTDNTPAATPNFAALISYRGRCYQPRNVRELLQLAQRLSDDTTANIDADTSTTANDWQPIRRRQTTTADE